MLEGFTYLSYPHVMPWPMMILEIDSAVEPHHIAQGLTGILLFRSVWILRYLEGETRVLFERFGVISAHPRHRNLWTRRQPISARALPRPAMGYMDVAREPEFLGGNDLDQIGDRREDAANRLRAIVVAAAKTKCPKAAQ